MFLYGVSQSSCDGRAEIEKVQAQLGDVVRVTKRAAQRLVPRASAAVRLGDARDLVRRLRHAEPIERGHERGRAQGVSVDAPRRARAPGPRRRRRRGRSPRGAFTSAGSSTVATSKTSRNARRHGRRGLLPEAPRLRDAPASACGPARTTSAPSGVGERQPVLPVRDGSERPVLVVEGATLDARPRVDDRRVPAVPRSGPSARARSGPRGRRRARRRGDRAGDRCFPVGRSRRPV